MVPLPTPTLRCGATAGYLGADRAAHLCSCVAQGQEEDLKSVVASLRAMYGVDYVYCWHGLPAYWSGISVEDPGARFFLVHSP